jgi:hypothetical protein
MTLATQIETAFPGVARIRDGRLRALVPFRANKERNIYC